MAISVQQLIAQLLQGMDQLQAQVTQLRAENERLAAQRNSLEQQVMTFANEPYEVLRNNVIVLVDEQDFFPDDAA